MTRIAVTLTTINRPTLLDSFLELHKRHGTGRAEVDYIVVGDRKTPSGVDAYVRGLNGKSASKFTYLGLDDQKHLFGHLTELWEHIPVDSFARRNYGDLLAYWEGYDLVVRIDDDNFPVDGDFIGGHAVAGREVTLNRVASDSGWYNICAALVERAGIPFFPRGYPYPERWKDVSITSAPTAVKVAVNAGLWLGDPDVDAITRLCKPVDATAFNPELHGESFALAIGTWAPINTQNTAFARTTIPAAFVSPFAGRYDDILSGYFLRSIVDHLGEAVCYGKPLLKQVRNAHNLWKDLEQEWIGCQTVPQLCTMLREISFDGSSYADCFGELIAAVRPQIDFETEFYGKILEGMAIWADLFAKPGTGA